MNAEVLHNANTTTAPRALIISGILLLVALALYVLRMYTRFRRVYKIRAEDLILSLAVVVLPHFKHREAVLTIQIGLGDCSILHDGRSSFLWPWSIRHISYTRQQSPSPALRLHIRNDGYMGRCTVTSFNSNNTYITTPS